MHDVIANIAKAGFDIHSYHACSKVVNEMFVGGQVSKKRAENVMKEIFGIVIETEFDHEAEIALKYMITEAVRRHVDGYIVSAEDAIKIAKDKTAKYFRDFPWYHVSFKPTLMDVPTAEEVIDVPVKEIKIARKKVGNKVVKPKKGLKQEAAKKIYEANRGAANSVIIGLFMSQLDMSKAGATTYLYNMKKANGDIVQGAKKGRKPKVG